MKNPLTGGCLCGKVRYLIKHPPVKMGVCHCRTCQRFTGSVYWPFLAVPAESFEVKGQTSEYATTGESNKKVVRCFCNQCGSALFGKPEIWPQLRIVSASSLDHPEIFEPEIIVWTEDALPWDLNKPEIKKFKRNSVK